MVDQRKFDSLNPCSWNLLVENLYIFPRVPWVSLLVSLSIHPAAWTAWPIDLIAVCFNLIDLKLTACLSLLAASRTSDEAASLYIAQLHIPECLLKLQRQYLLLASCHNMLAVTIYCRVPGGLGLQQTARPLSRDETRSVNPLVLHRWTSSN